MDGQDESEDDMEGAHVLPKLKSFRGAIQSLEDVWCFLQSQECTAEAISTGTKIDTLVSHVPSATHATLHDFFRQNMHTLHVIQKSLYAVFPCVSINLPAKDTSI